jgi:Mn2+/Fe2+ NRAMP family transporter
MIIILSRVHPKLSEIILESLFAGSLIQKQNMTDSIIMSLVIATFMPYNLFLHSHLAKMRSNEPNSSSNYVKINSVAINYNDLTFYDGQKRQLALEKESLFIVVLCNLFVIIIAGTTFYGQHEGVVHRAKNKRASLAKHIENADLYNGYHCRSSCDGGSIRWRCFSTIRRLVTRACILLPAILIAATAGREDATRLLFASHVVLGL